MGNKLRINSGDTNLAKLRKSRGMTQQEMADELRCTRKTYANYESGKQPPNIKHLLYMADFFKVSTDYILGRSDCTSVPRDQISKYLGLTDSAMDTLCHFLYHEDEYATRDGQSGRQLLPVLNELLSAEHRLSAEKLLNGVRDYLHADYCIPVYHDGNSSIQNINGQNVLAPNCIVPDNDYDRINLIDGRNVYIQHFAKSKDNPNDNIPVCITPALLRSAALKQIVEALDLAAYAE